MTHKYALGQTVVFTPAPDEIVGSVMNGKVTRLLPKDGGGYQYYIQFGPDGQQRRAHEDQLRAVTQPGSQQAGAVHDTRP